MEAEPFSDECAQAEQRRLEKHRTEFAVSLRAINEFLPQPLCAVLDVGGGPGRYAIELSRQGYGVTLLDISTENLSWPSRRQARLKCRWLTQSTPMR